MWWYTCEHDSCYTEVINKVWLGANTLFLFVHLPCSYIIIACDMSGKLEHYMVILPVYKCCSCLPHPNSYMHSYISSTNQLRCMLRYCCPFYDFMEFFLLLCMHAYIIFQSINMANLTALVLCHTLIVNELHWKIVYSACRYIEPMHSCVYSYCSVHQ